MATTNALQKSGGRPRGGPAPLFGLFTILWILFVVALIFNRGALDTVWSWFIGLPLVLQLLGWLLFLPITLGLWVWESDWTLWLRVLLIVMVGTGNLTTFKPRANRRCGLPAWDSETEHDQAMTYQRMHAKGDRGTGMKALVVYDSKFGNTERLARVIAATLGAGEPITIVAASQASERDLSGIGLLAVGGPTQGHGLSPLLRDFLDRLPSEAVRDLPSVTFDTRVTWPRVLAGSAAAAAHKRLARKGAKLLAKPESFLVNGSQGPLVDRELERAATWANEVRTAAGLPEQVPPAAAAKV